MDKNLQDILFEKYSFLKKSKGNSPREYFYWGIECENGWFDLLDNLFKEIEKLDIKVNVFQIKEKFGGLRFYYSCMTNEFSWDFSFAFNKITKYKIQRLVDFIRNKIFRYKTKEEILHDLIMEYENKSYNTCERCGNLGSLRTNTGWYRVLCLEHYLSELANKQL